MKSFNSVLLVDDDLMSNKINEQIILKSKFALNVTSYLDANKALDYLREVIKTGLANFPNVVFIDINMPEMDGWEFFDELNQFPESAINECIVIMLTSYADPTKIEKSKMKYDFIFKPLTIDKLEMLFSQQHKA